MLDTAEEFGESLFECASSFCFFDLGAGKAGAAFCCSCCAFPLPVSMLEARNAPIAHCMDTS